VRSDSLRALFGWTTPPDMFVLGAQLGALARAPVPTDDTDAFKRSMAVAVPTLYKALDGMLCGADATDDSAAVLAALSEQPCIWSGESFVLPASTAMRSPLNLAPWLHTVPAGLQVFDGLLTKLGVRPHIEAGQYLQLLQKLASDADGTPLARDALQLVLAVVQQLASPQHQPLPPGIVHLPDRAGVLAPSHELMYDDAPWLSDGNLMMPGGAAALPAAPVPATRSRRVHLDVAHDVAQRLGAQSLRGWLVSRNADTLSLGQENVEAFGQHESLTSRTRDAANNELASRPRNATARCTLPSDHGGHRLFACGHHSSCRAAQHPRAVRRRHRHPARAHPKCRRRRRHARRLSA
jgi:sacsin